MKSLVISPAGDLELRELDPPRPRPHQALVQTISGGVCGTDAALAGTCFKGVGADQYPLVLGHESVGRVIETGDQVVSYRVGDIVLLPFVPEPTQQGAPLGSAWGAFSEFALVDDARALAELGDPGLVSEVAPAQSIVPPGIDPVLAPVLVTLREVYSAIQVSGIDLSAPICVYGSGPVAMAFVKLLKLQAAPQVISVVRSAAKASLMTEFGADHCVDSSTTAVPEAISALAPGGVGTVVDAVGKDEVINQGLTLLRDRGLVFCYGVPKRNSMHLDWAAAPYNWTLRFQQMPRKDEEGACHEQIVQWVLAGRLSLADFVSAVVPIDQAPEFFAGYLAGQTTRKIIFQFQPRPASRTAEPERK